jgi:hypothetical protein
MTVKLSQLRKVRSLAKKTLGSTRVGRAMRLPGYYINKYDRKVVVGDLTDRAPSGGVAGLTCCPGWYIDCIPIKSSSSSTTPPLPDECNVAL